MYIYIYILVSIIYIYICMYMKHITCMKCTLLIARIPTLVCIHTSIQLIYLLTVYSSDE